MNFSYEFGVGSSELVNSKLKQSLFFLISLALAGGVVAGYAEEAEKAADWPAVIARLQQEVYRKPGLAHARQQLAIAYNNYGVELSEQGHWELAVKQLEESVRLDGDNSQARENLSRVFLNEAYDAYKQRRLPESLDLIGKALQANPELASAYALQGEIEYASQKLKEAKASWEQALKLDASQVEIKKKLDQLTQELPVESDFERVSQASFDVRFQEGIERAFGFDVRDALLEARRQVGSDFAYWPKQRLVVLVYSAESFRKLRQETPEWVGGQFDGKIRVPLPNGQLNVASVRQILFHEYTHAVIHDLTNGNCPFWLNEGLAEYQGRKQMPGPLAQLIRAQQEGKLVSWQQLSDQFSHALSADSVALGYQESYSIVNYLVERYGFWRVRRLLKAINEGQAWDAALTAEYRLKLKTLESNWQTWLSEFLSRT